MGPAIDVEVVYVATIRGTRIWVPGASSTWQLLVAPRTKGGGPYRSREVDDVTREVVEDYIAWWFHGDRHSGRGEVKLLEGWRLRRLSLSPETLFTPPELVAA